MSKQRQGRVSAQTITIEIRPGNGGDDAEKFAAELCTSLAKALERAGHLAPIEDLSALGRGFVIETDAKRRLVSWLQGTHVIQRIPKGSAARHTSSATVVVLQDTARQDEIVVRSDDPDIRVERYRGSGPGGQHRNKVSTAIRLLHKPTGIMVTRESGRSQSANLESALRQLSEELQERQAKSSRSQVDKQRSILAPVRNPTNQKDFTHNEQRGEVVHHATGRRFPLKSWRSGKVPIAG